MAGYEWSEEAHSLPPAPGTLVLEESVTSSTFNPLSRRAWRSVEMFPLLGPPKHPSPYHPPILTGLSCPQSHRAPEPHQCFLRPGLHTLRSGYNGDGEGRRLCKSSCCSAYPGLLTFQNTSESLILRRHSIFPDLWAEIFTTFCGWNIYSHTHI